MANFNTQNHRLGFVKTPYLDRTPSPLKTVKIKTDLLDSDNINSISSKDLKELGLEELGEVSIHDNKEYYYISSANAILTKILKIVERDIQERKHNIRNIRREVLILEDLFEKDPKRLGTDFKSFQDWLKSTAGKHYNRIYTEFKAARVERDLGIAPGTLDYKFIKPLLFPRVYIPKSLSGGSIKKEVFGSIKNEAGFQLQKRAFELACQKAGIDNIQKDAKKLKLYHVDLAVKQVKEENPKVFLKRKSKTNKVENTFLKIKETFNEQEISELISMLESLVVRSGCPD